MKIENRQKLLVMAALSGVLLLAADRLVIAPLTTLWKERASRIADLSKSLADGNLLLARDQAITERWHEMQTNALPANQAETRVLKAVDRWIRASSITFTAMNPQWRQDGEDYMTLECRADGSGNILALSRFLYELERDPLPLRAEDFEITAKDNDGQQLSLVVRFSGLVLTGGQP